jgi:hypothetical protein
MGGWDECGRIFCLEEITEKDTVIIVYETRVYTAAWRVPGLAFLSEGGGGVQVDSEVL